MPEIKTNKQGTCTDVHHASTTDKLSGNYMLERREGNGGMNIILEGKGRREEEEKRKVGKEREERKGASPGRQRAPDPKISRAGGYSNYFQMLVGRSVSSDPHFKES